MTTLPMGIGGNARWQWNSARDEIAEPALVDNLTPVVFFPTVPDNEMWAFERIVMLNEQRPDFVQVRLFLDDDFTNRTNAHEDATRLVDGIGPAEQLEVLSRPFPLQVPGGYRLGVVWLGDAETLADGAARAQITSYVRG